MSKKAKTKKSKAKSRIITSQFAAASPPYREKDMLPGTLPFRLDFVYINMAKWQNLRRLTSNQYAFFGTFFTLGHGSLKASVAQNYSIKTFLLYFELKLGIKFKIKPHGLRLRFINAHTH